MNPPLLFDLAGKRIYVAGHSGMAGSAIARRLAREGCEILTANHAALDLSDQRQTEEWLAREKPDAVFLAAARAGGVNANSSYPAALIGDNLAIALNVIRGAHAAGVKKLLFLSSSCIYPRFVGEPIIEEQLLTGPLEPSNELYAVAKIAGIKLCQAYRCQYRADFISVIATTLYGSGDNYHPEHSHAPAALVRRLHEAKVSGARNVVVWGTGKSRRDFLGADDLADACVFVMKHYSANGFLNIGTGEDITISDFAWLVADVVGYRGQIVFDPTRPDGTPRKLLDLSKLAELGWVPKTPLRAGLEAAYADFRARIAPALAVPDSALATGRLLSIRDRFRNRNHER